MTVGNCFVMKGNINKSFSRVYPFKLALEELFKPPLWQRLADSLAMKCSLSIGGKEIYLFLTWFGISLEFPLNSLFLYDLVKTLSLSVKKILSYV